MNFDRAGELDRLCMFPERGTCRVFLFVCGWWWMGVRGWGVEMEWRWGFSPPTMRATRHARMTHAATRGVSGALSMADPNAVSYTHLTLPTIA